MTVPIYPTPRRLTDELVPEFDAVLKVVAGEEEGVDEAQDSRLVCRHLRLPKLVHNDAETVPLLLHQLYQNNRKHPNE